MIGTKEELWRLIEQRNNEPVWLEPETVEAVADSMRNPAVRTVAECEDADATVDNPSLEEARVTMTWPDGRVLELGAREWLGARFLARKGEEQE